MLPFNKKPAREPAATSDGSWSPISLRELNELIRRSEAVISPAERRVCECIRIQPAKWREASYGDLGGGFWAVGVFGGSVLRHNDIEDGFSVSRYSTYGEPAEYWCSRAQLHHRISLRYRFLDRADTTAETSPSGRPAD